MANFKMPAGTHRQKLSKTLQKSEDQRLNFILTKKLLSVLFRFFQNGVNFKDKTKQQKERSQSDSSEAKNIGIKYIGIIAATPNH